MNAFLSTLFLDPAKLNVLLLFVLFCGAVMINIHFARRGRRLFVRKLAGLNAVDEAVGRATELGRAVYYIPGIDSMEEPQTIASLAVLRHVARLTARYATSLSVPNRDPLTFASARETVREAYLEEGRPDLFEETMVSYVTYDQFAYTASVSGMMVRERPAANFLVGAFHAESLLLAESGQSTGAIQIAGTAEVAQLPFFVCACDYTLIGEELFAAGAYLSQDPAQLGSVKGQDFTKGLVVLVIVVGVLLAQIAFATGAGEDSGWLGLERFLAISGGR